MSLGSDHLGSGDNLKAWPRGDAGRSRKPLNSGRRYDYALAAGEMIFFEHGRLGQLGGPPGRLPHVLGYLGLKLDCASNIDLDYFRQGDEEARGRGESNRAFFMSHVAQKYQMPLDYVRELFTRDYLYRDEIDPRHELSGHGTTTLIQTCLPGVVKRPYREPGPDKAYQALAYLLQMLPGSVYEANLVEFMFEHLEANGQTDVRSRWAALWR